MFKKMLESRLNKPFKWSKYLKKGIAKNPKTGKMEYSWKLHETWEDYPTPDYNDIHTYCFVEFEEGGQAFCYRTRNPDLKVGDMVYVPVGYKHEKKVAKIVSMKDYKGKKAPYPLEKTKHIIGKVEE